MGAYKLNKPYMEAVELAGGTPIALGYCTNSIEEFLKISSGIILSGGDDAFDNPRDRFETTLCKIAIKRGVPVLGICRGMQLLNAVLGGTLVDDIPTHIKTYINHRPNEARDLQTHSVAVAKGSVLHSILDTDDIGVNSIHHQCIGRVGDGLVASAIAPDGIIEAVELPLEIHPFAVGVQWHPEELVSLHPKQLNLFEALVNACLV